jgi:hypothetical protein
MESDGSLLCSQEPPLAPILNQMNAMHTPTAYFFYIHFNIVLPSTFGSLIADSIVK